MSEETKNGRMDAFAIIEREGLDKPIWLKVGSSFQNRDGSNTLEQPQGGCKLRCNRSSAAARLSTVNESADIYLEIGQETAATTTSNPTRSSTTRRVVEAPAPYPETEDLLTPPTSSRTDGPATSRPVAFKHKWSPLRYGCHTLERIGLLETAAHRGGGRNPYNSGTAMIPIGAVKNTESYFSVFQQPLWGSAGIRCEKRLA